MYTQLSISISDSYCMHGITKGDHVTECSYSWIQCYNNDACMINVQLIASYVLCNYRMANNHAVST